ncbi:MAG: FAD-binding protein [Bacteroidetes bacterium]|jgi:xylitol oxidase|nr:FAD-binding protein [Bacteroidota bacterium]
MDKRTFLKTSSALLAGSFLTPFKPVIPRNLQEIRTNWAGNLEYSASNYYQPRTLNELQELVARLDKLRMLGTRHCFNTVADSTENQISLERIDHFMELDEEAQTVTISAGVTYGELGPFLDERGYALHNLASLPHISVVGACATATHGSGVNNGNLATAVNGIEFMDAGGELHHLTREEDGDKFNGAVVALGSLGVVTKLTLDVEPAYQMRQFVYLQLPVSELENNFEEIMSAGYSVSLFTDYQSDSVNQVWIKQKIEGVAAALPDPGQNFFGATLADRHVHPIIEISAENCTRQMGIPGPWYNRLPHFRLEFTPSSGKELQAEYFVPQDHAVEAYQQISSMKSDLEPLLMISEVRTIAEDDLWMSSTSGRPSVAFHFTCQQNWDELKKVLPVIEEKLRPFDVRPHWGKMFTMSPSRLESVYDRIADFRNLLAEYDPNGKFQNHFVRQNIIGS